MKSNLRAWALGVLLAGFSLGASGCAPSQVTHYSGQIGRFSEDGVSFTVPMVERAKDLRAEDRFWELRRNIGNSMVVILAPTQEHQAAPADPQFRTNMTLTKVDLGADPVEVEKFAQEQIALLSEELKPQGLQQGRDGVAPWVEFQAQRAGQSVHCKAWFFVAPPEEGQENYEGYVFLGSTAAGKRAPQDLHTFQQIASTFSFGAFRSGFVKHAEALRHWQTKLGLIAPAAPAPALRDGSALKATPAAQSTPAAAPPAAQVTSAKSATPAPATKPAPVAKPAPTAPQAPPPTPETPAAPKPASQASAAPAP